MNRFRGLLFVWAIAMIGHGMAVHAADANTIRTHAPTRPLPQAATRPLESGPSYFVDATKGDDADAGTKDAPWKTVQHAVGRLRPGDTLYLRGGLYYEHIEVTAAGSTNKPITLRCYPGELATLDGGLREFHDAPQTAWEPCPDGAAGEYRSVRAYPDLGGDAEHTNVLGNFADSLVPLHGYRLRGDLQSDNPYWNVDNKVGKDTFVYCGPGIWYDTVSGRIHIRLAHTTLSGLGDDNYRGETDPRKLPLVIGGHRGGPTLTLKDCQHVRLQDLVLRGAREATLSLVDCSNIELDGLTVYGGSSPIQVRDTWGLRMQHTACRGLAAPWTFRGSLKYRAIESRLFNGSGWDPTGADNRQFEIVHCEFTDSVDGVFLGNVRGVRFHHNLVDNVSDDGVFLSAGTAYDGTTHGGDMHIYMNLFSRCLTTFAFGVGHGRQKTIADQDNPKQAAKQTGSGMYIFRNVFDFRRPVMYYWPTGPDAPQEISSLGRVASDHGSPAWEPMWIYHNTILAGDPPRYNYLTDGLGGAMGHGTSRRVFNNIVCQAVGLPGSTLPDPAVDFQADGNLAWSLSDGLAFQDDLFGKFRRMPAFEKSKERYPPGWTTNDKFADPKFIRLVRDGLQPPDLSLSPDSPAIDSGVAVPSDWPNPLRSSDKGLPDIGALPLGVKAWQVGVRARLTVSGETGVKQAESPPATSWSLPIVEDPRGKSSVKPAIVFQGYPAFDAPLIEFALRRRGVPVETTERVWLETTEYANYSLVAVDGSLARAKIDKIAYDAEDLDRVRAFLNGGGTLLLMRDRLDLFAAPEGRKFLVEIGGTALRPPKPKLKFRLPDHPWIKHLSADEPYPWLEINGAPLWADRGEALIAGATGGSLLHRLPVGNGQLIYMGWSPANAIPHGRQPSTVANETAFEQQMQVLLNIVGK